MNKSQLSERDICTKFITPSLRRAGWDEMTQLREEVSQTESRRLLEAAPRSARGRDAGTASPGVLTLERYAEYRKGLIRVSGSGRF
jgi:hypothetical protein